jgi:hypothetical protein
MKQTTIDWVGGIAGLILGVALGLSITLPIRRVVSHDDQQMKQAVEQAIHRKYNPPGHCPHPYGCFVSWIGPTSMYGWPCEAMACGGIPFNGGDDSVIWTDGVGTEDDGKRVAIALELSKPVGRVTETIWKVAVMSHPGTDTGTIGSMAK